VFPAVNLIYSRFAMEIECSYGYIFFNEEELYTCIIESASITEPETRIIGFKGKHLPRKKSLDCQAIWFKNCTVNYLPRGLDKIFPSLIAFGILNCKLMEISRNDLKEMTNLAYFYIHDNELQSLPDDLFQDMLELREISIINNKKLKQMSSNLIKVIMRNGLEYVDLSYNGCINAYYCPDYENSVNSVQELIKIIDDKCGEPEEDSRQRNLLEMPLDCWIVADGKEFRFNKKVLVVQSPVFAAMVEEDPEACEIRLRKYAHSTVAAFVDFLYTGRVKNGISFIGLFTLASQFKIAHLRSISEKKLVKNFEELDIFKTYMVGSQYSSDCLKKAALDKLKTMFPGKKLSDDSIDNIESVKELLRAHRNHENETQEAKRACKRKRDDADDKLECFLQKYTEQIMK
jgi:BTB/POZ domain